MAISNLWRHKTELDGCPDPVEAYQALRSFQPLMLDGMGAHPEARYAYIALGGIADVRIQGGHCEILRNELDLPLEAPADATMAQRLRTLFEATRADVDEPEAFTGGWIGYLAYEALAWFEPSLEVHEGPTPQACLRLCRDVLVIDRRESKAWIWTTDLELGDAGTHRVEAYQEALRQGVQVPEVAPFSATWGTSLDQPDFEAAVHQLRTLIADGDHFQTNLATRFQTPCELDPVAVYHELSTANPSPYMALMEWPDHAVISSSPEQLFSVQDGIIRSRPIAGTRPRGDGHEDEALEQELIQDEKEQAEHTMLLDLVRNDVAKVAVPGTVHVPERMSVERYRHVMHLVSRVEAEVRAGTDVVDWIAALFPGGTITGAPKHRACMRIHNHEPVARGPYTGSAGFVSWSHNTHWNILIRTLLLHDGHATVHAGSGIVADSEPTREWHEAGHKARALLQAALGQSGGGNPTRLGEVTRHGDWALPRPTQRIQARVLLIDNYDSFTYNLADYCAALGAQVHVIRNDENLDAAMDSFEPSHLIIGPGPGRPEDAGNSHAAASTGLPTLGICLGHQVMGQIAGATILNEPPVHGKTSAVHHEGPFLDGLPDPLIATRYHSLIVDPKTLPPTWRPIAWADDVMMAMQHQSLPHIGLQFHPESISTNQGLEIMQRFLEL